MQEALMVLGFTTAICGDFSAIRRSPSPRPSPPGSTAIELRRNGFFPILIVILLLISKNLSRARLRLGLRLRACQCGLSLNSMPVHPFPSPMGERVAGGRVRRRFMVPMRVKSSDSSLLQRSSPVIRFVIRACGRSYRCATKLTMLYERWRQIVKENRNDLALCEVASGQQWTFGQLDAAAENAATATDAIVYPRGISAEFIFAVLHAWRAGKVVCPLEVGQAPLQLSKLPPGCVHFKTTSGTTGGPRVIAFTAEQLMANAENIVATMGLRRDWPNLGVISLTHSYGFSNLVTPLLLHGIPLILCDSPLPEAVRRAGTEYSALTLPAVPALWRAWHEAKAIPPNVRLAISAGAPLPRALEQAVFERMGLKVHNIY